MPATVIYRCQARANSDIALAALRGVFDPGFKSNTITTDAVVQRQLRQWGGVIARWPTFIAVDDVYGALQSGSRDRLMHVDAVAVMDHFNIGGPTTSPWRLAYIHWRYWKMRRSRVAWDRVASDSTARGPICAG